jgi:cell division protein FtsN
MARDYAKQRVLQPVKRKTHWGALAIFLGVCVVIIAAVIGMNHLRKNPNNFFASLESSFKHKPKAAKIENSDKTVQKNSEDDVHFEFYSELQNNQIHSEPAVSAENVVEKPPVQLTTSAESAKKNLPADQYFLQVAVFNDAKSASQSRVSLLLAGFQSQVIKIQQEGQTVYAVQQGPFATLTSAKAAQKKLQNKGFVSEIKKPL